MALPLKKEAEFKFSQKELNAFKTLKVKLTVFYFSKRTSDAESRYHSFEFEVLAIIYALKRLRIYLHELKLKNVVDCNSLAMALKKHDINPRIARWVLELQNYNYSTEHHAGNLSGSAE